MANPILSHLISGTVFDIYGNKLEGATVSITHATRGSVPAKLTVSNGTYILNLSKLDSQWVIGEEITVTASKTAEGTKSVTVAITSGGGQTVNITLAETSDLSFYVNPRDVYTLSYSILTHYDGENITRLRPFPVQTEGPLDKYRASDMKIDGKVRYYGFLDRLGNWYIRRDDLSDTNNRTYRYAKGSSNYPTTLTAMKALTYDLFSNVF